MNKTRCDSWAMERMNIPQRLWGAAYAAMPQILQTPVSRYFTRLDEWLGKGVGFLIYGPPGVGKTSAGAVVLKAGWEHAKTGYFISVKDLRQSIKEETTFDNSESVYARCKTVDILVLDDLAPDDFKNFTLGIGEIEHLLTNRSMRSKTTILTTRMMPLEIRESAPTFLPALQGTFLSVLVTGDNQKASADAELRRSLGVG